MSRLEPNAEALQARELALAIVRRLRDHDHVAYLAGGCVRDKLLGLEPNDYDVATDALPPLVRRLFRRSQYVGEAFGVVLVRRRLVSVQVATFRNEWGYEDGRRPTQVNFSDAKQDALRRDFTINGLFEDPLADCAGQRIIDYVGGLADLEARVIRAIGEANLRFGEDHLRMLRAVRFAAALDFNLERSTEVAIRKHKDHLGAISRERIGQEVRRMLTGRRPEKAARLIQRLHLDAPTFEEAHLDVPLPALRQIELGASFAMVLAAWAMDRHAPGAATSKTIARIDMGSAVVRWRRALCLSNEERDALRQLLSLLPRVLDWPHLALAQRKRLLARPLWPQLLRLVQAMAGRSAVSDVLQQVIPEAQALQAEGVAPRPLINGDDLIEVGHQPGPTFSRLLQAVYDAQLESRVRTKIQAMNWIRDHFWSLRPDETDPDQ